MVSENGQNPCGLSRVQVMEMDAGAKETGTQAKGEGTMNFRNFISRLFSRKQKEHVSEPVQKPVDPIKTDEPTKRNIGSWNNTFACWRYDRAANKARRKAARAARKINRKAA